MADYLVINLPQNEEQPASWLVADGNGAVKGAIGSGTLEAAAAEVGDHAVIVIVPGTDVLTMAVDLPVRSGAKLRAAVPYALEDQLADEVETLHFATGSHRDSGLLPVAVVNHDTLSQWVGRLNDNGIYPTRVVPDYHGVQAVPNTISLVAMGKQILINDGKELEFTIENLGPGDALAIAGLLHRTDGDEKDDDDTADASPRHLVAWVEPGLDEAYRHDWNALRTELDSVDVNVLRDGAFPRLAVAVAGGAGINLLQGPYSKRTEVAAALRPWRVAASLLLGIALLSLAGKGVDYLDLKRQEAALQDQYMAVYEVLRPGDARLPADPNSVADSLVRQVLGNNLAPTQVFLPSLMQLAAAIGANREADVEAVSYRAGVVDVRLTAPNVATLDKIQKAVSDSGRFTASIQATSQDDSGKVNSRIQIRDTGA